MRKAEKDRKFLIQHTMYTRNVSYQCYHTYNYMNYRITIM